MEQYLLNTGIYKGEWNYTGKEDHFIIWDGEGEAILGVNNEDIAKLICDAGNTYRACGILPSDLLKLIKTTTK